MIKLISLSLGTALLLGLGGCASYPLVPTKLIVDFDNSKAGTLYAMKNSAGLENCMNNRNNPNGYSIYGGHCTFQPKDVPEKVVIEYARWLKSGEGTRRYIRERRDTMRNQMNLYIETSRELSYPENNGLKRVGSVKSMPSPNSHHPLGVPSPSTPSNY